MEAPARLVTPEGVVLQFETAGLGSRLLAVLIDLVIQATVLVLANLALAALLSSSDASATVGVVLLLVVFTAVLIGYPVAFETLWRGRTPGKAALGLRVVTKEGAPVRFRHAVVRGFLTIVDFYLTSGAAAVISVLLTRDNQRLGDLAAGTLVLRERSGAGRPTAVRFPVPYGYEAYTATLDVAGLTPDEYGAVRSFLLRSATLPPEVRAALALDLARTVAARMHHTAPPGVIPEAFLACVMAAVQQRSAAVAPPAQTWAPAAAAWAAAAPAATSSPVAEPAPAGTTQSGAGAFAPPT